MMKTLLGKTINKLTVQKELGKNKFGHKIYNCKCECGKETTVLRQALLSGNTQSCGCLQLECSRKRPFEYLYNYLTRINKHRDNELSYEDYIKFTKIDTCHYCDSKIEWHPFQSSKENERFRPRNYNLDRMDNSKGYTKENCVVCCKVCNMVKGFTLTYSEMLMLKPTLIDIQNLRTEKEVVNDDN